MGERGTSNVRNGNIRDSTGWNGTVVWVVGASSGIGAATAQELRRRQAKVAISARRTEELAEVAEGQMLCVPLDVCDRAAVKAAYETVTAELGEPDVVIYAAGYWKQAQAGSFDPDEFAMHVNVNVGGLGNVLGEVVPAFTARGSGTIVAIASVAGYRGMPGAEYYGATKAAQINLCEALRASLRPKGVRVVTVCPGFVDTPMTAGNAFRMPFKISAVQAARDIVTGLERGKQEIVFPLPMMVAMKLARCLPGRTWTRLVSR